MKTTGRPLLIAILVVAGLTPFACSKNQEAARGDESTGVHALDRAAEHSTAREGEPPPLYDGLGDHRREITTSSEQAQDYFDQGLRLQYAFNHAEAIRSYQAALAADPECAMCWWGIALAAGNNINAGMDQAGGRLAYEAARRAEALAEDATAPERMLIEAITARYGPEPLENRPSLDSAYARAMERVAESYPRDTDVLTLYAASLMNLSPWFYWEGPYDDRSPRPGTLRLVSTLEDALEIEREHPGACHYLIHAVEAAFPERAVECADRLASRMPAAGHIVHMPTAERLHGSLLSAQLPLHGVRGDDGGHEG